MASIALILHKKWRISCGTFVSQPCPSSPCGNLPNPVYTTKQLSLHTNRIPNNFHCTRTEYQTTFTAYEQNTKQLSLHTNRIPNNFHCIRTEYQTTFTAYEQNTKQLSLHTNRIHMLSEFMSFITSINLYISLI